MKKTVRKIAVAILAVVIFSALTMTAFAGSTQKYFSKFISFAGFTQIAEPERKEDASPLFLEIHNNNAATMYYTRALTCNQNGENAVNLTYYNNQFVECVRCYTGQFYGINSMIYERGTGYATIAIQSCGPSLMTTGYWAPDTVQEFEIAAP